MIVILRILLLLILTTNTVFATVSDSIQAELKKYYPDLKFRLDNLMQVKERTWLLFVPKQAVNTESPVLLMKTEGEDYLFSNGWIYTPIKDHTIKSFDYYPEEFQRQLLQNQIAQEFLVPKKFTLPRDLAVTAGRLPLDLTNVELASDREMAFRKKLEENKSTLPPFLIYSNQMRSLDLITLDESLVSNPKSSSNISNLPIKQSFASDFTYLSRIKNIKDSVYLSDFHQGKIYKVSAPAQTKPDATKPLEKFEPNTKYSNELFLDLRSYKINSKLVDFAFSNDDSVIYLLTASENELVIIHAGTKQLVKRITVPAGSDELVVLSRSASEPDKVFFRSRSANKVLVLNSFDYNIASEIDLNKLDDRYLFIPHSFAVFPDHMLLSVEAISKNHKDGLASGGKVLVLDVITGALQKIIDLDFIPYGLKNQDKNSLALIYGYDPKTYYSKIVSLDISDYSMDMIDLGADFPALRNIALSPESSLVLIPSPSTNLLGVVDLKNFTLLKKISTDKPINFVSEI